MTETMRAPPPGEGSPRRLEALNDGIFAIVMTIIVLEVRIPDGPESSLGTQLLAVVPTLLTYALTFATLGILWFGNRAQSEYIAVANHPLIWLNLVFLGTIALVPFSAALLGRYPTSRFAVVEYGLHLTVAAFIHGFTWLYVVHHPLLLRRALSPRYRQLSQITTFAIAIGYALATLIGFFIPLAGLIAFVLVPVPFVAGWYYQMLARINNGR
ncbi:DUF1211 domain-containing protein [Herbiconiux sp. VKM Ac-1786]|uniref:TMEM175 family protein n=1 Tax=Herbiconiux sp. VKM Ac-1786 TaxID=2783824 RepID=UPI00188A97A8|nr:TMEM175 family protein [Herbiconiux sp. VKM Ac-1786]MBF4571900.1 DUF1211 domain-containing protein [Herbiconiux sp. VKM Ac-1786]